MNLLQAIEQDKIKPGDLVKFKAGYIIKIGEDGRFLTEEGGEFPIRVSDMKREDFEIIKADKNPVVLSYDQAWECRDDKVWGEMFRPYYNAGFKAGDENGELKQWENHQPLRESVKEFASIDDPNDYMTAFELVKIALKNLKPLKETG